VVPAVLIRFFSLARAGSKTSAFEVCHANTLAWLPANPILDEHEALYDFDVSGGAQ
jgi:hypothetical protein